MPSRYIDGKTVSLRCDFSTTKPGDIQHEIEIDGPATLTMNGVILPENRS